MTARFRNKVALVLGAGSVGPGFGNGKATALLLRARGRRGLRRRPRPRRAGRDPERDRGRGRQLREPRRRRHGRPCARPAGAGLPRAVRPDRRHGQQRRRLGAGRSGQHGGRGLGPAARYESELRLPELQAGDPDHGRPGRRRDRQPRLDRGAPVLRPGRGRLCGGQGGADPVLAGDRGQVRAKERAHQHGDPGPDGHAAGQGKAGRRARRWRRRRN